jgi:hypothetical protein
MEATMRLPNIGAASRPRRIHELARGMKITTTLLDEVLPEFTINVISGWLGRDFRDRVARIGGGLA